ncbi:MAG: hypothetical protein JWQ49_4558 [Edaphobacter sp.]|nr:hypothetical protein [Edaphobacter sp.]
MRLLGGSLEVGVEVELNHGPVLQKLMVKEVGGLDELDFYAAAVVSVEGSGDRGAKGHGITVCFTPAIHFNAVFLRTARVKCGCG